ncbi:MAG: protein kinase [Calditrichaeota bacterium]|nr:protein kinase [Calditrichota bacterium]
MPNHTSQHRIGNYRILETILDKGTARVYLAVHQHLGRKTFLKVYTGGDQTLIQRFEREARIVADLNHPAIVQIYDFGEEDGQYFIAMEYVEGQNLQEYIRDRQLDADQILDLAFQIASSVAVFHEKGYIHRDLKPENILIDRDGRVKITDFGLSVHERLTRITNEGNLLGTPLYMAPEQINNLPVSPATDVFALGVIFYQMATGEHPFYAEHIGELFSRILSTEPAEISKRRSDLPDWFTRLVHRMLEKEPEKRPASALEVVQVFRVHHGGGLKDSARHQVPAGKKSVFPRKRRLALVAAGVFILLGILFWQSREDIWRFAFLAADSTHQDVTAVSDSGNAVLAVSPPLPLPENSKMTAAQNPAELSVNIESPQPVELSPHTDTLSSGEAEETALLVRTWPWCRVYLNYQFMDVTPMLKPLQVQPGKYILSLQNPDYPSWSDTIVVYPNRLNVVAYNLDTLFMRLDLQVIPWGKVYIDGQFIGITPFKKPIYLTKRTHILRIENEFYQTYEDTLRWKGQLVIEKSVVLQELPITRRKKDL